MRLLRLDLERYGPFTGRSLSFRPDAALHLVHGPNEAGKSSALSAITDLLYGFEERSAAGFLHPYPTLRIGAEILGPDGGTVTVRRRKGKGLRNTLIDDADIALDDALLDPLLAGVTREVFLRSFGLSQSGLRKGADAILKGRGDIGEALFAASSGLRDVVGLRERLGAEADELFSPRSPKKPFAEALARFEAARREMREQALGASAVKALDETIAQHKARQEAITARRRAIATERSRLTRVRLISPILRNIDRLWMEIEALGSLPLVEATFSQKVFDIRDNLELAAVTAERLTKDEAASVARLADLHRDVAILQAAADIEDLGRQKAVVDQASADLPKRRSEAAGHVAAIHSIAQQLGLADRAALEARRPSEPLLARLRALVAEHRRVETGRAEAERMLSRERTAVADAERELAARPGLPAPEPLRRTLKAIRQALSAVANVRDQRGSLERRRKQLDERIARLSPAPSESAALWRGALPDDAAIAEFEDRFAAIAAETTRDEDERRRLAAASLAARRTLDELLVGDDLPDATALLAARRRRDASFDALIARPEPAAINTYRGEVTDADRMADRRHTEADRVARHEREQRQLQDALDGLAALDRAAVERKQMRAAIDTEWAIAFAGLAVTPGSARQMAGWAREVRALRDERVAIMDGMAIVEAGEARLEAERPALLALAAAIGLADAQSRSIETLDREIDDRLSTIEAAAVRAQALDDRLAAGRAAFEAAGRSLAEADAALVAFEARWAAELPAIGLDGSASIPEVEAALDIWRRVPDKLELLGLAEHRVAAMEADESRFRAAVAAVAAQAAPDLGGDEASVARALIARLKTANDTETKRRLEQERLSEARAALARAVAGRDASTSVLAELAARAGVPPETLDDVAKRLETRADLETALGDLRRDLDMQGGGRAEAVLRGEIAGLDSDAIAAMEEGLTQEAEQLDAEDKVVAADHGDARRRREAMETGSGAAGAAQALAMASADLERITRDYLVLRAASSLIGTAVERQRASRQDPLVARAGALLAHLTAGAFEGLAVDYDDADDPSLVAVRRDGGHVAVTGLSEGTCDQLYLALRLASLEDFVDRRSPMPFIGDDIVMTFDDARLACALEALAETGRRLQVILFTHHRHVVEIARAKLGEALDLIEL